jgi:hypothetical protein
MHHRPPEPTQVVHRISSDAAESQYQNTTRVTPNPPGSGNVSTSRATNDEAPRNRLSWATDPGDFDTTALTADGKLSSNTSWLAAPSESNPQEPLGNGNRFRTSQVEFLSMFGLLLFGVFAAIGHHLFYSYLNSKEVDETAVDQTWAIRIGTAFAYLFKTTLVAAIAVVYAQSFWFTVRRNLFEIDTLDNFFALLTNPLLFYHRSLYGKASLTLFALAMVSWLLPISAVFAPGALTGSFPLQRSQLILVTTGERTLVENVAVPVLAPMTNNFGLVFQPSVLSVVQTIANRVMFDSEIIPWASPCGSDC